jgi:hypothetical protein
MSRNRNRAKLNESSTPREYKLTLLKHEYDYCFICCKRSGSFYYDCSPMSMKRKGRHGNGKLISTFDARSYRTWKHTRRTQHKE